MYNYLFSQTVGIDDKISEVHSKIKLFSEDDLIDRVILPLLSKMKFQRAQKTPHHGPKEKGLDIRPFYEIDKFERRIYYGAQVKARDIHTDSSETKGNAVGISQQLCLALDSEFLDGEDNVRKQIDKILLITSGKVTDDARELLHKKIQNRSLFIIDGVLLSRYIVKHGLMDQILHTGKSVRRNRSQKSSRIIV